VSVTSRMLLCLIMTVAVLFARADAEAAGIESMVMPGKLVQGHARYESECSKCHQPFSKQSQSRLCLDCHEKVDEDVRDSRGFHGRSGVGRKKCTGCHDDHLGRDADIMKFSRETFDHDQTDYPLRGAHVPADCAGCHPPGKKFRDAAHECVSCHRQDDVHKGHLGSKCHACHEVNTWKKHEFDHDKTRYPLHGRHRAVACDSCHPAQRYKGTPKLCNDCHRFNDVHAGRFGAECSSCHNETSWQKISFDHDRNTDYPLTGRHRSASCASCHTGDTFEKKLPDDCYSCHRDVDQHKGSYGNKCESCHATDDWAKSRFDHDRKTDFPLRGRHAKIACTACHRGDVAHEKPETACIDCHRADDVHEGKQGKQCGRCHNEAGWTRKVRFDHGLTRFPLIGLHAVVPCEECHLSAVYTDTGSECIDCHRKDDTHHGRLGDRCAMCHNPNGWSLWVFDHKARTGFPLDGGHAGIVCESCHSQPVHGIFTISSSCDSCHRRDDVHDGRFGRYCNRCHNTKAFDQVEIR
jgi:hypothetical protein